MAIWELRHYQATPGRAEELQQRFAEAAIPAFTRNGFTFEALWRDTDEPDNFWYLLQFRDQEHRSTAWDRFRSDAVWQDAKTRSEARGPLIADSSSTLLARLTGPISQQNLILLTRLQS